MDQKKIGRFIAENRKLKKMTQVELAEKLGVSDRSVSKWENGRCSRIYHCSSHYARNWGLRSMNF